MVKREPDLFLVEEFVKVTLSPYVFIICAEYLGRYTLFVAKQPKSGIFIKLNKNTPKISFLMFVDDFIFFL